MPGGAPNPPHRHFQAGVCTADGSGRGYCWGLVVYWTIAVLSIYYRDANIVSEWIA